MDDAYELDDVLMSAVTLLRGIHAETRAMRLEARSMLGLKLSEEETADLAAQVACADEIAVFFSDVEDDAPSGMRG